LVDRSDCEATGEIARASGHRGYLRRGRMLYCNWRLYARSETRGMVLYGPCGRGRYKASATHRAKHIGAWRFDQSRELGSRPTQLWYLSRASLATKLTTLTTYYHPCSPIPCLKHTPCKLAQLTLVATIYVQAIDKATHMNCSDPLLSSSCLVRTAHWYVALCLCVPLWKPALSSSQDQPDFQFAWDVGIGEQLTTQRHIRMSVEIHT
jgi:hypothetical protein